VLEALFLLRYHQPPEMVFLLGLPVAKWSICVVVTLLLKKYILAFCIGPPVSASRTWCSIVSVYFILFIKWYWYLWTYTFDNQFKFKLNTNQTNKPDHCTSASSFQMQLPSRWRKVSINITFRVHTVLCSTDVLVSTCNTGGIRAAHSLQRRCPCIQFYVDLKSIVFVQPGDWQLCRPTHYYVSSFIWLATVKSSLTHYDHCAFIFLLCNFSAANNPPEQSTDIFKYNLCWILCAEISWPFYFHMPLVHSFTSSILLFLVFMAVCGQYVTLYK